MHSSGVTVTLSSHEPSRVTASTIASERMYSLVLVWPKKNGENASTMTSEEVSNGSASVRPAASQACRRSSQAARRRSMSSAMTMPLSTSSPSARMIAAIDTVCSSTLSARIAISVPRMVSGTIAPTIRPVRQPRNSITTAITMSTVSPMTWCILPISRSTTSAWNVTTCCEKPTGSIRAVSPSFCRSAWPTCAML
ncbi:hypothetical protein XTGART2_1856 [Xanthomonas translucens pv. graminis]|uniref:Uncharacterized protein n=1 Tax=Xanthomonas graminis pv. graminis TaxID=134874 RepID=A0A1M4IJH4_9XANT|nr:hypothetical protein XTG29_02474 [Xanthomonas translucens pv. graminis ART-Xtg29]SBV41834.1 hypothetical protein XTGART2_1856 [Xanthomonas translucens pv. graminis]SBV42455.1 hypothetical protein XTGART9_1857 [Xanthomonas translucens pv. graminis]SBV47247.1 hypothetical protein XTGART29_1885 [Xanthomonas translucens pv. graminis ART-Xtg29]SBV55233.1 hypothetical protein XTGART10_1864 [Xanthomonas translucens pv. graminis]